MDLSSLSATVQRNCHISDALHARNYTLCTYLLKMREFYRWEQGYPFNVSLPKDALGDWITEREALWEQLEINRFEPLHLGQSEIDPFETTAINQELAAQGLVYSGGYGGYAAPHFFLADLLRAEQREGLPVLIAGREHARDMAAPPAMLLDGTLFIRRESMRRMLWEKIEEWRWKKHQDAMARAMAHYDFDADFTQALEQMTDNEVESALLHEVGEWRAEERLGRGLAGAAADRFRLARRNRGAGGARPRGRLHLHPAHAAGAGKQSRAAFLLRQFQGHAARALSRAERGLPALGGGRSIASPARHGAARGAALDGNGPASAATASRKPGVLRRRNRAHVRKVN